MKKIIVFGATGNIGAYFIDYCNEQIDKSQYEIVAVGRRKTDFFSRYDVEYIKVDICNDIDFNKLPITDVYAIVNLTGMLPAYSKENDVFSYVETNIKGSLRILEYARKVNADRVLYTQTWAVQGGYWNCVSELSPLMPRKLVYKGDHAFYCITKSMIEDTMEFYHQEYGIKNFVFRLPNVYMYHPDSEYYVDGSKKVVAYRYMIEQAIQGKDIELWGDPKAYKDILYVKDLCQMMYRSLFAKCNGGTYNAGTGQKTTLLEQIQGIIDVFSPIDKKVNIIYNPNGSGFTSSVMDVNNAKTELGYMPEYNYINYLVDYKKEREQKRFNQLWTSKMS